MTQGFIRVVENLYYPKLTLEDMNRLTEEDEDEDEDEQDEVCVMLCDDGCTAPSNCSCRRMMVLALGSRRIMVWNPSVVEVDCSRDVGSRLEANCALAKMFSRDIER